MSLLIEKTKHIAVFDVVMKKPKIDQTVEHSEISPLMVDVFVASSSTQGLFACLTWDLAFEPPPLSFPVLEKCALMASATPALSTRIRELEKPVPEPEPMCLVCVITGFRLVTASNCSPDTCLSFMFLGFVVDGTGEWPGMHAQEVLRKSSVGRPQVKLDGFPGQVPGRKNGGLCQVM